MSSNDITSQTTDVSGLEEENNYITPILLNAEKDDSSSLGHFYEVGHLHEENVRPGLLSGSQRDALQIKPHDTDNIPPRLSASSSSSSVSSHFDTVS